MPVITRSRSRLLESSAQSAESHTSGTVTNSGSQEVTLDVDSQDDRVNEEREAQGGAGMADERDQAVADGEDGVDAGDGNGGDDDATIRAPSSPRRVVYSPTASGLVVRAVPFPSPPPPPGPWRPVNIFPADHLHPVQPRNRHLEQFPFDSTIDLDAELDFLIGEDNILQSNFPFGHADEIDEIADFDLFLRAAGATLDPMDPLDPTNRIMDAPEQIQQDNDAAEHGLGVVTEDVEMEDVSATGAGAGTGAQPEGAQQQQQQGPAQPDGPQQDPAQPIDYVQKAINEDRGRRQRTRERVLAARREMEARIAQYNARRAATATAAAQLGGGGRGGASASASTNTAATATTAAPPFPTAPNPATIARARALAAEAEHVPQRIVYIPTPDEVDAQLRSAGLPPADPPTVDIMVGEDETLESILDEQIKREKEAERKKRVSKKEREQREKDKKLLDDMAKWL